MTLLRPPRHNKWFRSRWPVPERVGEWLRVEVRIWVLSAGPSTESYGRVCRLPSVESRHRNHPWLPSTDHGRVSYGKEPDLGNGWVALDQQRAWLATWPESQASRRTSHRGVPSDLFHVRAGIRSNKILWGDSRRRILGPKRAGDGTQPRGK